MIRLKNKNIAILCCVVCFGVLWGYFMLSRLSRLLIHATRKDLEDLELSDFPTKLGRYYNYNWNNSRQLNLGKYAKFFAPALNQTEYKWYIKIISKFKDHCEKCNVTYTIWAGSVIGAYVFHGFQPWDDDFDVQVNSSQKLVFEACLRSVPGYQLYTNDQFQWKFYSNDIGVQTRYEWKWPFIDIFFFEENATHIYDVTEPNKPREYYPRSEILPFQSGIFENMILPVPNNMEAYLNKRYSMRDSCLSNSFDHKHEMPTTWISISCSKLFSVYPFVHRFEEKNIPYEELRLGNKTLYRLRRTKSKS